MPTSSAVTHADMAQTNIGLFVCIRRGDRAIKSLPDNVDLLRLEGAHRSDKTNKRCATDHDHFLSEIEDFTFEDLFAVSPPDVILNLRRDVTEMEEEVRQLEKMVTPPPGVLDWGKMIEAFGVGFSIIMGFYMLYTIGTTIFRSLRLMD